MTHHTYAGHTLAEIKEAAGLADHGEWQSSAIMVDAFGKVAQAVCSDYQAVFLTDGNEPRHSMNVDFAATANPATVIAMAARIEELEAELHRVTTEPPTGTAPCHRLCEHVALKSRHEADRRRIRELEAQLNASILARREAQLEAQQAKEERNRVGVDIRRETVAKIDAARLEGFEAAREIAHAACVEFAESHLVASYIERAIGADRCASAIRAMKPSTPRSPVADPQPWPHPDGFAGGLTEKQP